MFPNRPCLPPHQFLRSHKLSFRRDLNAKYARENIFRFFSCFLASYKDLYPSEYINSNGRRSLVKILLRYYVSQVEPQDLW